MQSSLNVPNSNRIDGGGAAGYRAKQFAKILDQFAPGGWLKSQPFQYCRGRGGDFREAVEISPSSLLALLYSNGKSPMIRRDWEIFRDDRLPQSEVLKCPTQNPGVPGFTDS